MPHPATPPGLSGRPTRARYIVLGFAATLSAISFIERATISVAVPMIREDLRIPADQMGWVFSSFVLAYALLEIPMGRLGDRFGPRGVLLKVVALWSFFTAATGWMWNRAALIVCRFLFGAGEAGCFPNLTKIITIWMPASERGRAQGVLWCCGRWGAAVAPSIMAFVLGLVSWRWAFSLLSLLGVGWMVAFAWWFRDHPQKHPGVNKAELALLDGAAKNAPSHVPAPWGKLLRRGSVWLLWLQYFCMAYGWYFYITWLPSYLQQARGLDLKQSALLAGLPTFMGGLGCLVGGWLAQAAAARWGNLRRARRTVAGGALLIAATLMVLFTQIQDDILAVSALALASFCVDLVMASAWGACMDVGGRNAGSLSGSMNMMGNLGGVVGPLAMGYALYGAQPATSTPPTPAAWTTAFLITAAVYSLGACCWLFIDPVTPLEEDASVNALTAHP